MYKLICASGLLAFSTAAWAGTCEDNFQSAGDVRNGLYFETSVKIAGLSAQSALGQLRQLAMDGGYEVGSELIQGNSGEFSFLQTSNHPALIVRATANNAGDVSLALKLAQSQKAKPEGVRNEFCSMLGKLKAGKEGEAIAAAARAKSGSDKIIDAQADKLSADIGREVKSAMRPVATKGYFTFSGPNATEADYGEAFAPIRAKYVGRKYRIDGQIYTASFNQMTKQMEVNYLVTKKRGLLGIQQKSEFNDLNFQITCILANDQVNLFKTLSNGNFVKLTGEVTQIDQGGMRLEQCRQAK